MIENKTLHKTDVIIVGAGPVGLFAVFELGLLDMTCAVIDILDRPGGQCAELYPEKPIYDIPALPEISGADLTENLMRQIRPFSPVFFLGQMAQDITKTPDNLWQITTDTGTVLQAPVVVIAGGGGSFTPKKMTLAEAGSFERRSLFYAVRERDSFKGKNVVIAGGGDSALDWALDLVRVARRVTLTHRRDEFRGAPARVGQMRHCVSSGLMDLAIGTPCALTGKNGQIETVVLETSEGGKMSIPCESLLVFYGLTMKAGPIAMWNLGAKDGLIPVDTEKFETARAGIFAIGDMCTYPGKLKLILSGFHESALMAQAAFRYVYPDKKLRFQYTTASTNLHEKLGVTQEKNA